MDSERTWRRGPSLVVAWVFVVACLLVACSSGSDNASTDEWAKDVCTALTTWQQALRDQATSAQSSFENASLDLAARKADLVAFMNTAVERTGKMIDEMEAAGTPDVEQGEEMMAGLEEGFGEIRQAFADAQRQAEALPVEDQLAFVQAATTLSGALQEATQKAQTTLADAARSYPEPAEAMDRQPECQSAQP